ncbi:hypothetical protein [Paenibacillus sp. PL91]|uniref:hypothetical protein n=1 Tax=Paenibacillus sp. PL91 TaxID=2729538 RepID=UPI00145F940E|nr:hypothetical protein [Paenibacillus sp. PL91]MBC9199591.1 hypothetical protein [Paenibacillus sp. PL91]
MNISQMMRSFLGEASGTDTRAMELKVGQVVRGVILQVMENNEALVQINGVQVRAKLEAPLQVGQTAMLQVQPQSSGALVTLKQVEPGAVGLPEDTFKEWAKQLALPEQKWAAHIVKDLRKEGVILNREVAQAFQQAAAAMPAGGDAEQWMQAAAATFKRGLPMTGATVAAMQQVMFGRSAHELLETMQQQLAALTSSDSNDGSGDAKPLTQAVAKVQALLTEGMELLRVVSNESESARTAGIGTKEAAAVKAPPAQMVRTELTQGQSTASGLASNDEGTADQPVSQAGRSAAAQPNWLGQMMKWMGVDHEQQLAKTFIAGNETSASQTAIAPQPSQAADTAAAAKPAAGAVPQPALHSGQTVEMSSKETPQTSAPPQGSTDDLDEPLQIRLHDTKHNVERAAAAIISSIADGIPVTDHAMPAQQESLKSALLALVSSDQTPPAIKETAQQLVQQITGQQLLLTPERNSSVLTHVTMFIPLNSPDGKQTASVHIQTRRGRKGELDSANCRLLFNLSMNTLGDTMVDVNVMDKIVSLNLWNDHPAISMLAESSRSEIASSLQQAGFQLLSLRTTPLPKAGAQAPEEAAAAATSLQVPDMTAFSSNRYKGVDYRI